MARLGPLQRSARSNAAGRESASRYESTHHQRPTALRKQPQRGNLNGGADQLRSGARVSRVTYRRQRAPREATRSWQVNRTPPFPSPHCTSAFGKKALHQPGGPRNRAPCCGRTFIQPRFGSLRRQTVGLARPSRLLANDAYAGTTKGQPRRIARISISPRTLINHVSMPTIPEVESLLLPVTHLFENT